MINLLLTDDHQLFRKGLRRLIDTFSDKYLIYEAANGIEALEMLTSSNIHIILLDIQMPLLGGIELIKKCGR